MMIAKYQKQLFVSGAVLLMLGFYTVFFFVPLVGGIVGSFFDWNPLAGQRDFIGLANYLRLLRTPLFYKALTNTLVFTAFAVVGKTLLGLLLALAINSLGKLQQFFRSIYFLPVIMPILAVAIVWKWLYHPRVGLLNTVLLQFSLSEPVNWLRNPTLVIPAVIVMSVWKDLGYALIIFIAALLNIPGEILEAAYIDGAGRWQRLRYIILPTLKPTMVFVVITSLIGYFQSFVQIFVMTKGGPGNASSVLSYLIYEQAFVEYKFGYASAISVILFLIIIIITLVQFHLMSRKE